MGSSNVADDVFTALSNATRQKIPERLVAGSATVSELAEPFDVKLPSFVQHLAVLEHGRLVTSTKRGRVRTYEIAPKQLRVTERWWSRQRELWERRFDQLDQYVRNLDTRSRDHE